MYQLCEHGKQDGEPCHECSNLAAKQPKPWYNKEYYIDLVERLKRQKEIAKEMIAELSDKAKWFGEVMAIMHADGGHYLAQHGPEKTAKDAVAKYHRLIQELQEARPAPKSAPNGTEEAQKHLTTGQVSQ